MTFPLGVLITALVTWALVRLFGAGATFAALLGVVTYSQVVRVAQYVLGLTQGVVIDVGRLDSVHDVGFSLARILDQPETPDLLVSLAARVDLFTLWATALVAVGVRVVAGLDRASAWVVALVVWLLGAVPILVGALLGG
ncbi:MAG: YIP1 family protein [Gemmatimonadota bacterium]